MIEFYVGMRFLEDNNKDFVEEYEVIEMSPDEKYLKLRNSEGYTHWRNRMNLSKITKLTDAPKTFSTEELSAEIIRGINKDFYGHLKG